MAGRVGDGPAEFLRGQQELDRVHGLLGGSLHVGLHLCRHRVGGGQDLKNLPVFSTNKWILSPSLLLPALISVV